MEPVEIVLRSSEEGGGGRVMRGKSNSDVL
jgi:hypothetical protein